MNPGDCAACATLGICSDHRDESRGEQGPSAEDLEIDRLRAEVRSLTEKKLELKREVSDLIGKLAVVRLDEREACAELIEDMRWSQTMQIAKAIRARGGK